MSSSCREARPRQFSKELEVEVCRLSVQNDAVCVHILAEGLRHLSRGDRRRQGRDGCSGPQFLTSVLRTMLTSPPSAWIPPPPFARRLSGSTRSSPMNEVALARMNQRIMAGVASTDLFAPGSTCRRPCWIFPRIKDRHQYLVCRISTADNASQIRASLARTLWHTPVTRGTFSTIPTRTCKRRVACPLSVTSRRLSIPSSTGPAHCSLVSAGAAKTPSTARHVPRTELGSAEPKTPTKWPDDAGSASVVNAEGTPQKSRSLEACDDVATRPAQISETVREKQDSAQSAGEDTVADATQAQVQKNGAVPQSASKGTGVGNASALPSSSARVASMHPRMSWRTGRTRATSARLCADLRSSSEHLGIWMRLLTS